MEPYTFDITGRTGRRIGSFQGNRSQGVAANGSKSERRMVRSGIPKGTALGTLLFFISINDIKSYLSSSICLFVYDSAIFSAIALNPTSIFQSKSLLPYTGLLGTLLTLTAHHLLLNFPVFQSFHLLKMQTSSVTFCALY